MRFFFNKAYVDVVWKFTSKLNKSHEIHQMKTNLKSRKFHPNLYGKKYKTCCILRTLYFFGLIFCKYWLFKCRISKNSQNTTNVNYRLFFCMNFLALQVCFEIPWNFLSSAVILHQQHLHKLSLKHEQIFFLSKPLPLPLFPYRMANL
jgi:hypothetical protein